LQAPRRRENQWRVVSTSVSDLVVPNAVVIVAASRPRKLEKVGVTREPTKLVAVPQKLLSAVAGAAVVQSWRVASSRTGRQGKVESRV
jgi:hypothetical protein